MGFVEGIQLAVTLLMLGAIVYVGLELRRGRHEAESTREAIRQAIHESDAHNEAHRKAMIDYAADVLRHTLDAGQQRGMGSTGLANDNAGPTEQPEDEGAEVIPFPRRESEPDPLKS